MWKEIHLVIVDDYSRFTWVKFLRSKDETPEFVTNFLKQIQVGLNKTVRFIRTDNGTEFVNQALSAYYEGVGISHQKSVPRTPQQNGVVERRNRTLVEAARTMMIFSKAPMFLWAEAVATACYTQNRSLIHTRHNKTPYELVHEKKPDLTFFRVFGALCYPTNDSENLGKFQAKADIGIFVGYAPSRKGYRIYNKRTRRLMETIHVTFDEMDQTMAPVRISSGPVPVRHNHHRGMLMQQKSNQLTTLQIISEDGPHDHPSGKIVGNPSCPVSTKNSSILCFVVLLSILNCLNMDLAPRPIYVMVLALKWIYKVMLDEYGDVLKNKARYHLQRDIAGEGIDFEESFCSSGRIEAIRNSLPCATKNMIIYQMDVKTVFSNVIFRKSLCIKPEGFEDQENPYHVSSSEESSISWGSSVDQELDLEEWLAPMYLTRQTIHMVLWYPKTTHVTNSYADADHAGCKIQRRSTSELKDYGFDFNKIPLYCDNKSAIALCCNNVQHSRSKHIDIRHHLQSEASGKIEWLNSTSCKRHINLQYSDQKPYQETNSMAEQNVPAQPPTRTDEQIVPRSQWLTIGKSNLLFNAQKIQKNPIFQISVDILKNTNFFQALTASANVPAIYLQQFWKTMSYNEKTGVYSCQLDEQWFDLSADLLRKALAITPVNPTHPFELPPTGDTVLDFVNELGYPEPIEFVSSIRTNYVYQPWRAILSLLNQCLTGKTSGSDKPRHPVLQMLWGIVTQTNVDHAELIWEEFTQGIQTFFSHKTSHKASLKNPTKKATPLLIPYGRFSKVIIYYLARNNNIHRRPDSAVHYTGDDYVLGNLKFVPKGETVEKTPRESASVQPATKRATPKKTTTTTPVKQSKPAPPPTKKPSKRKLPQKVRKGKPTFKLVDEDDEDRQETIPHEEGNDPDLELAMKLSLETPQEKGEGEGDDADLERAIKLSLDPAFLPHGRAPVGGVTIRDPVSEATPKLHEVVGKGKAVVTEEQVAHSLIDLSKKKRTTDQFILIRRDQTPPDSTTGPSSQPEDYTSEKEIHESSSTSDSERTESDTETAAPKDDKDQGEVDSSTVSSGVSIPVSDPVKAHEALAGPDPEPMKEDQTGSDSGKLHVSLAGPNPEHMDDEFLATAYPKVHENLKLITDERVIDDKPESHSGSMSSMKNLDDTFNFGDQFLHDKPTEDDQEKSKVREESDSTIPDSSHQTVTSTPPVIPPFTEVSSSKPSLLVTPPPINTEATTITTSLPEITPFIALQLRVARLEQEMSEVKKTDHSADVLASIRTQVPTAVDNYLGTKLDDALLKVLERHTADLIEKYSVLPGPESVKNQESEKSPKEIIKAKKEQDEEKQDSTYSIRSTDKVDLEEFDLKSALFSHMNKKKSANKNTTNYRLYHALMEALIADEDAMDKEVADKVKDHKRKHDSDDDEDDDDDEGPSAGSNQGRSTKRRRSDSAASGSAKPPPKADDQSSKKPRESDPESEHSEQSSDDISKQDKGDGSDMEDTDNAHIPKVSTTTWFKPIPESERPATPDHNGPSPK
ncbi:retrovirus-related pol polyprotein from transposon TNT 1-94 [Tanacetum coccineum]|uniref:Retrovirus-related pol polyprotein from transposon TNT 1-94 n=1 Tax=Tanacetum coccineum TaxID=301880 RepID=A0ABQ4XKN0_9ASTR